MTAVGVTVEAREPTESVVQRVTTLITALLASLWCAGLLVSAVLVVVRGTADSALSRALLPALLLTGALTAALNWASWWGQTRVLRPRSGTGPGVDLEVSVRRHPLLVGVATTLAVAVIMASQVWITAATAFPGPGDEGLVQVSRIGTVLLATTGAILVSAFLPEGWRWAYVLAVSAVRVPWALPGGSADPAGTRFSIALGFVAMCFILGEMYYLRAVSRMGDVAVRQSTQAVVDAAGRAAASTEAGRIDGLVHDHILAALLLTSRADDPEDAPFIRRSAASALAALSEISAPEADEGDAEEVTVPAFATQLIAAVRTEDPTIITTGRGARTSPIPTDVATVLTAAALEAVRNTLRHADGGGTHVVTRRVTVRATQEQVTVTVADDGVGFDPASAGEGRYGVAGSILGRMESLDGGLADVDSAPGRGTQVTLTWRDPAAAQEETSTDDDPGVRPRATTGLLSAENTEAAYFSWLRDTPTDAIRFGPTLRASLGVFGGIVYSALGSLAYFDPAWVSPLALAIFVVGFAITVRSWSGDPLADPTPGTAVMLAVLGPALLVMTLAAWDHSAPVLSHLWTVMLLYVVTVLLSFNNYPRSAWFCSLTGGLVLLVWTLVAGEARAMPVEGWALHVFLPWAANRVQRSTFEAMGASAEIASSYRDEADARAREASVAAARRTRGQRVDTLARPLLERLAAGQRTERPVRIEAARLEAHLRDDLRARCFRDTDVTRAANDARQAGLRVELMDDGALDDAPPALRAHVVDVAVSVLDAALTGSVIVRVGPPGRDTVATILTETASGVTQRLEIPADATEEVLHA